MISVNAMANLKFPNFFVVLALAFAVPMGLSCGSDRVENAWAFDEANERQDDAGGCESDQDCPEGMYCYGPTQCGATWSCQEGFPPCSAAPPSMACGCDGEVVSIAAGCPQRHAWDFVQVRLGDQFDDRQWGTPCDSDLQFPVTVSLAISVDGFDEDVAGQQLRVRFEDPSIHATAGEFEDEVAGDGFIDFDVSFDYEEHREVALLVWFDRDGDGKCSDEDMVWRGILHGENVDMDLETFEGEATVKVRHMNEAQGFEAGEGCVRWDS